MYMEECNFFDEVQTGLDYGREDFVGVENYRRNSSCIENTLIAVAFLSQRTQRAIQDQRSERVNVNIKYCIGCS